MLQAQKVMESKLGNELNLPKGSKILDAGCGEGLVAIHLAAEFGHVIHGVDILDWSIEEAIKNKQKSLLGGLTFEVGDYSDLRAPDNSFDAIYTMETLVHSPDFNKTLREFYRVLKPGGVLVNHEYVLDDNLPPKDAAAWKVMFSECPMLDAFHNFRVSKMNDHWERAGFINISASDITHRVEPFMKRLYQIAFIPYYTLKLFGKESNYVNTFAGVKSYQLRNQFHYTIMKSYKPNSHR